MYKVKCYICGTSFDADETNDDCPFCDWEYVGWEGELDETERVSANSMTIKEAKENFSKGLNIWGEPLPKSTKFKKDK